MLGGAVAAMAVASRAEGVTGFDLELAPSERTRRPPDAHPIDLR
jgi:hypothetical protein